MLGPLCNQTVNLELRQILELFISSLLKKEITRTGYSTKTLSKSIDRSLFVEVKKSADLYNKFTQLD